MKEGYFILNRSLFDSSLWLDEPFTRGQAWVDLINLANFERREVFFKGSYHIIEKGQMFYSYKFFINRWKWSRNRVLNFFRQLQALRMVSVEGTRYGTIITIENYTFYQSRGTTKGTRKGTAKGEPKGEPKGIQHNKREEINKKGNIIKSEIIDGFLIETDADGREYAQKVEQ